MKNKGFTLLELVISFFIVTVAVSGAFVILQKVITSTTLSESSLTASFLAQEGLGIVRSIRDQNWIENDPSGWIHGLSTCSSGKFCEGKYSDNQTLDSFDEPTARFLNIDSNGFYSYGSGLQTKFKRKIYINSVDSDHIKVKVMVQWQDSGRNYEITVLEELYNWY